MDIFHWTLTDIDQTDIESLIPFVYRYPRWKEAHEKDGKTPRKKTAYADQIMI